MPKPENVILSLLWKTSIWKLPVVRDIMGEIEDLPVMVGMSIILDLHFGADVHIEKTIAHAMVSFNLERIGRNVMTVATE